MLRHYTQRLKQWLPLVICLLSIANAFAQTSNPVQQNFVNYASTTLHEKIFVHTDRTTYLAGELLWFKVYCVDAATNKPLDMSKVVYAELISKEQKSVLQAKIAMAGGSGAGSLYIPVNIANGNYKLRAYTGWMKNFDAAYYFEKELTIVNPMIAPATATVKAAEPAVDVQFYPEGGNMLAGVEGKMAFKITGADGRSINNANGAVIDQRNDTVARFKPLRAGIGSFMLSPAIGSTYRAAINIAGSKPVITPLPAIKTSGYAMQLTDNGDKLQVTVKSIGADGNVYLFAHTRQTPKLMQVAALANGAAGFDIDKSKLGEGISHLTIFDEGKRPVCERLYFIQPKKQLLVDASADAGNYATRKKVTIDITANDATAKNTTADLSLAVYRIDSLQQADRDEIFSYLWLQADLRGHIEDPGYYFTNTADARAAVDNLLLSQGWRRFKWDEVLQNTPPAFKFLPELNGHIVTAKALSAANGKPVANALAYLSIPGRMVQLYTSKSDATGKLLFNTKNFFGPGELVAQTNSLTDSTVRIEINNPFSTNYTQWNVPAFSLSPKQRGAIEQRSLGMQTLNIYSADKIKRFYNAVPDSSAFYDKPDKAYLLDDYTRFNTLEEVLREYIPEADIAKKGKNYSLKMLSRNGFLETPPLVLLDGVPVFNTNKIIGISALKIYKLESIRNKYYWGQATHDGILSFTTYKGDLGGIEMDPNALVIDYEGMQQQREFYSPVYDTEAKAKNRMPDIRSLLYWAPSIITKTGEKTTVSFYTSDQTGSYIGLIQGLTSTGNAGSKMFKFEVK